MFGGGGNTAIVLRSRCNLEPVRSVRAELPDADCCPAGPRSMCVGLLRPGYSDNMYVIGQTDTAVSSAIAGPRDRLTDGQ